MNPPAQPTHPIHVEALGIIAGSRTLPLELAAEARRQGVKRIVVAAFEGETDPAMSSLADEVVWMKVGQLSKMIGVFADRGIRHCVMAGQIAPSNLFDLRPDFRAMGLLMRLKERNAHSIFGAIADEMEKDGVQLIEATPWLRPLMPGEGFRIGAEPSEEQLRDARFGFRMAKEISRLEIGQSVVVKAGTVLAVEGFEGTDACLTRGGTLAGKDGGAVAVKVARQKHDMRFDIPCVGLKTLETCVAARISVLAFEADKTLLLDRRDCEPFLKKHRLTVMAAQ